MRGAFVSPPLEDIWLFVRTYHRQQEELRSTLFYTLRFFWRKPNVVVGLDADSHMDEKAGAELRRSWPFPEVLFMDVDKSLLGWVMQQGAYYYADTAVPAHAPFVAMVDSDTAFVSAATRPSLFDELGRPHVIAQVGRPSPGLYWDAVPHETRRILRGQPALLRGMSYFPIVVATRHLRALREHVAALHGQPFSLVWKPIARPGQFVAYGAFDVIINYLWLHHRDKYSWRLQRITYEEGGSAAHHANRAPVGDAPGGHQRFGVDEATAEALLRDSRLTLPLPRIAIHASRHWPWHGTANASLRHEPFLDQLQFASLLQAGMCLSFNRSARRAYFGELPLLENEGRTRPAMPPADCMLSTDAACVHPGKCTRETLANGIATSLHWSFEASDWSWDPRTAVALRLFYDRLEAHSQGRRSYYLRAPFR